MKALSFTVVPVRSRRHQALFDRDLPFRGRRERPKTQYQRRPKHPLKDQQ